MRTEKERETTMEQSDALDRRRQVRMWAWGREGRGSDQCGHFLEQVHSC